MNTLSRTSVASRSPIAAAVFSIVCALLLPVMLVGYVILVVRIYLAGRTSGASTTAQGPLFARWLMHELRVRRTSQRIVF